MAPLGYLSEKLDGVYALVSYIDGEVRHWGRSGKALSNCEELDEIFWGALEESDYHNMDYIFISEVTSNDPLAKLSGYLTPTRVNESKFTPSNMVDNFHDVISAQEFVDGLSWDLFSMRQRLLNNILMPLDIYPISQTTIYYEGARMVSLEWIKLGKEGGVFAQEALWIAGARNETIIKVKEKLSFDVTVVGICSGKEGSKYENTLGKLVVVFRAFGKPNGETFEIPLSGMTDAQRDLWWTQPELIIGACVKMDAKSFTENGNLREPRFKEVRSDKSSDFPVTLLSSINRITKGKADWSVHNWC